MGKTEKKFSLYEILFFIRGIEHVRNYSLFTYDALISTKLKANQIVIHGYICP